MEPRNYLRTVAYELGGVAAVRTVSYGAYGANHGREELADGYAVAVRAPDSGNGSCSTKFSPALTEVPATVTVGASWTASATESSNYSGCTLDGLPATWTVQGKATATETVQVAAGTFTAIRLEFETTRRLQNGSSVTRSVCWRDVASGMDVKCTRDRVTVNAAGASTTTSETEELVGYAVGATRKRKDAVERFAGEWASAYSPLNLRDCRMQIGAAGDITGTCKSGYASFTHGITGTIDAQGNFDVRIPTDSNGEARFHGKADSPMLLQGPASNLVGTDNWKYNHK
ncbi:hypothetical protein C9I28_13190 [Pseudoduganella armeniaca]|uniref:Uncharacterized protein n=1 Tax=Pseudoduganella armeniaca TaxID=2072590 RepID=A0A2R4CAC1_9BURK|nr:hypothetical protein C9I28_13190 [Pseudoduganella armeniaca]